MGGASSRNKDKVLVNGISKHLNVGKPTGTSGHHHHQQQHEHYWFSQSQRQPSFLDGNSFSYNTNPHNITASYNHHEGHHSQHSQQHYYHAPMSRGASSQCCLNEHESTTSTAFAARFVPQLYEPLHLTSLGKPTALGQAGITPSPPPPPPISTSVATAHQQQQLDYSDDLYQGASAFPSTASGASSQQQQHHHNQLHQLQQTCAPAYEDATADLYLEHGHDPATLYASGMHLNGAASNSNSNHETPSHQLHNFQQQQQQAQQLSRRQAATTYENPFTWKQQKFQDQGGASALTSASLYGGSSRICASGGSGNTRSQASGAHARHVHERGGCQSRASASIHSNPLSSYLSSQYQNQAVPTTTTATTTTTRNLAAGVRRRKLVVAQHKRAAQERGLALNMEDRRRSGQLGLLPAAVQDQELQSKAVMNFIENCQDELGKYMYLRNLKDFNEQLFYFTLTNNVEKLMPLVYTPTVGLACQKFSEIYMRPRGLFVTAKDLGRVRQVVANWPEKDVRVIVVTDGERILGLGDLGANGMGISIGKLSLYTALAGIPPQNVLPVCIDVGTNNEQNLADPFYIGLRQRRLRGDQYDQLIEEFMQAVVERWGRSCLIQFEDFANTTAFALLERYRQNYCTFNDDIQGTASVSLSGLLTAARVTGKRLANCAFLFYGAGEANLGTANLLIMAMQEEGLSKTEAKKSIYLVDSKGLVASSREDLNEHKREFAQDMEHLRELETIVDRVKPTALIGASAQGGSFNESICRKMAKYNERPIIFALSNPTSKAECTAAQAYEWTEARCVFASGSPFEALQLNGRTYVTGQGNNAYIFPGVGLAAIAAHTHIVPEQTFLVSARALSDQVTNDELEMGLVYPSLSKIRQVTLRVATRCLEYFYAERLANYCPEPSNKEQFLRSFQYDPKY